MSLIPSSYVAPSGNSHWAFAPQSGDAGPRISYTTTSIDADGQTIDEEVLVDPHASWARGLRSLMEKHPQMFKDVDWAVPEDQPDSTVVREPREPQEPDDLTARQRARAPGWRVLKDGSTLSDTLGRFTSYMYMHEYSRAADLHAATWNYIHGRLPAQATRYIRKRFDIAKMFVQDLEKAAAARQGQPGLEDAQREVLVNANGVLQNGNMPRDAHILLDEEMQRQLAAPVPLPQPVPLPDADPLPDIDPPDTAGPALEPGTKAPQRPEVAQRLAYIEDYYRELMNLEGRTAPTVMQEAFFENGLLYFVPLDTALQVFPDGGAWSFLFVSGYKPALDSSIYVKLPDDDVNDYELQMLNGQYRVLGRFDDWRPNPFFCNDPVVREAQLKALRDAKEKAKTIPRRRPRQASALS
ncbi:hypothetical protein GT347_17595 [Xylophilus rhododendri]|uniref:Uncharacterized protein n=1 Tax=Xylophilus rhododendri TaxID=2697032 RepID=A0A857J6K2_9BURK|nr:hypothetical protein [Xylophilus rhododendri]QHI99630.1 hypothetical protein GT347_17595 [Xylophilus rhododendri]